MTGPLALILMGWLLFGVGLLIHAIDPTAGEALIAYSTAIFLFVAGAVTSILDSRY